MPGTALLRPLSILPTGPDNDTSTADTVSRMAQYIQAGANHEPVRAAARDAMKGMPLSIPAWLKCRLVWEWVTRHISFRPDEDILRSIGMPEDREFLIPPYLLIEYRAGDCDDFAMLTAAMLKCLGVEARIVTVKCDLSEPWRWSHVYACAVLEDGSPMTLDTAAAAQGHGLEPGWEVPFWYERREWAC